MIAMVLGIIINFGLDYLFIIRMQMGVTGAAMATVIAFSVSGILLFIYLISGQARLKLKPRSMRLEPGIALGIIRAGLPSLDRKSNV